MGSIVRPRTALMVAGMLACVRLLATCPTESEICVYGGTSGGVVAAVAAARLGKSVVLLSQNAHVGGMSASGLGVTDRGVIGSIGGIAREFYLRVGQHYGSSGAVFFFEPHVAEEVFREMLEEASVPVHAHQRLASVELEGLRLRRMIMEDGSVYDAQMFVDATYEGDLMAAAGVTFTVGREGASTYGESLAGIRPLSGRYDYDPYLISGEPSSGLLPFVQPGDGGQVGDADHRVQAYNFRLCLTQNATNKIPMAPPEDYTESDYELFARYLEARVAADGSVSLGQVIHLQTIIPNGKTDINANGELSTDYVGASYTWATNTHAGRDRIQRQHEDYIRGFLHFLATSPRVPSAVRLETQSWGLAKDEFADTGGWPWQLYVREARRMVSDYVMTQQNGTGERHVPDPVALASYPIDSHGVQRAAAGGFTRAEGSVGGSVPYPYGVSYRSIIPRIGECENLFCTFALSASHIGFCSIRMEPVFMMLSQSAATAAAFSLDESVPVQNLVYSRLAAQLRADGQLLSWEGGAYSTNGIILDEDEPGVAVTGSWTYGANAGGWRGDYYHDQNAGKGTKSIRYLPNFPTKGTYEVYAWWVEHANRAANVPYDVLHDAGTTRVLVNQQVPSGGWFKLLTTNFTAGAGHGVTIRNDGTTGYVIADGVRFLPLGTAALPPEPPTVEIVASDTVAAEHGPDSAWFSLVRGGDLTPAIAVRYAVTGTASNGEDFTALPGEVSLGSGVRSVRIQVVPLPDSLAEGDETVTLTLEPSTHYTLTTLSSATIKLRDRPFDAWRRAQFHPAELADPLVSGDLADPDQDGLENLMEYALGLNPKTADAAGQPVASVDNGWFFYTYTLAKEALDVKATTLVSSDLLDWSADPQEILEVSCTDEGRCRRVVIRLAESVFHRRQTYLQLKIQRI